MGKILILLKAQLLNGFAINEILMPKSKNRKSAILMMSAFVILGISMGFYFYEIAKMLVQVGLRDILMPYTVTTACFAIVFMTALKVNGSFYGNKDYDMLMSLPVRPCEIFVSRFITLYCMNLAITVVFVLPTSIVWASHMANVWLYLSILILSIFFIPIIPMCIAALLGIVVIILSSKFRYSNLVSLMLYLIFVGGILFFSITASGGQEEFIELSSILIQRTYRLYPLALMFSPTFVMGQFWGIISYMILSLLILLVFAKAMESRYRAINELVLSYKKVTHTHNKKISFNTPFMALYKKEFQRYFGSYLYMMNASFGLFTVIVLSIICLFIPLETVGNVMGIPNFAESLGAYAPFLIAGCISLSCPTASSLSLEGNNLWILQTTPISKKTVINSKIAVSLTLYSVTIAISTIVLGWKVGLSPLDTVLLIVFSSCFGLFTAILGITLNDTFPNFHWSNEVQVIKQSTPVFLSLLILMGLALAGFFAVNWVPVVYKGIAMICICILLLVASGVMYFKVTKDLALWYE